MGTAFSVIYAELGSRLGDTAHAVWTLAQKKRFVNGAIRHANEAGLRRLVVDETTLDVTASTTEYTLPNTVANKDMLLAVYIEPDASGDPWREENMWTVYESRTYTNSVEAVSLKLKFDEELPDTAGSDIRLLFLASHQELSADADTTSIPTEYLYDYAMYLAYSETRASAGVDRDWYDKQAAKYNQLAQTSLKAAQAAQPQIAPRVRGRVW